MHTFSGKTFFFLTEVQKSVSQDHMNEMLLVRKEKILSETSANIRNHSIQEYNWLWNHVIFRAVDTVELNEIELLYSILFGCSVALGT